MISFSRSQKNSTGFTLVELLVVISIIALLSSIVLTTVNSAREKGRLAVGKQLEDQVYHAIAGQIALEWNFDECAGVTAKDSSGNGQDGVLQAGAGWSADTPNGVGCSLLLDGALPQALLSPVSSQFANIGNLLTVSVWVKFPLQNGFTLMNFIGAGKLPFGMGIDPTNNGLVGFGVQDSGGPLVNYWGRDSLLTGKWNQIVGSWQTGGKVVIYINGVEVNSYAATANPVETIVGGQFYIGSGTYTNLLVDNLRIYHGNMSALSVRNIYLAEKAQRETKTARDQ